MHEKLARFFTSPVAGLVGIVASVMWAAFGFFAGPAMLYIVASLQAIGTLYRENLALKRAKQPALSLVFADNQLCDSLHHDGALRIFRVGILNKGESVSNVAVKVARIHPELPRVFPMQELQQTHADEGVSRFDVNKSEEPLVYVDVVHQRLYSQDQRSSRTVGGRTQASFQRKGETASMSFPFANGARPIPLESDTYLVWLAIDGVGGQPLKLVLRKNSHGQYDMAKAWPN